MAALNQPYAASPGQSRQTRSVSPNTSDTDEDLRQTDNTPTPGAAPSSKKRLAAISEVEGSPVTDYSAASDDEDATPHNELHMHNLSLEEQQRRQEYQADFAERQQIGGGMLRQVTIKSGYLHKKGEKRKVGSVQYCRPSVPRLTAVPMYLRSCRLGRSVISCCGPTGCATTRMTRYVKYSAIVGCNRLM